MASAAEASPTSVAPEDSPHSLSFEQVQHLCKLLSEGVNIISQQEDLPTLNISPSRLLRILRKLLEEKGILLKDIIINGSCASFCLAEDPEDHPPPHDLDVLLIVELRDDSDLDIILQQLLIALPKFFPEGTQTIGISSLMLENSYLEKKVKIVTDGTDRWSLITLGGEGGKNIELKFAHHMRRQYEFSVDSFQIVVDPILIFDDACDGESSAQVTPNFFPRVYATSIYGSFSDALHHLNKRLICTKNPERIRGGGLLKYCYLQACGYKPADSEVMNSLEPYMCSRFLIDFPFHTQYAKIDKYVSTRFLQQGNFTQAIDFLNILLRVLSRCSMEKERYKTKEIVTQIRAHLTRSAPPAAPLTLPPPAPLAPPPPPAALLPTPPPAALPPPLAYYSVQLSPRVAYHISPRDNRNCRRHRHPQQYGRQSGGLGRRNNGTATTAEVFVEETP